MSFGSRLRDLRQANHLTQLELATRLNLSKANISKYEAGTIQPNIETLVVLAKLFSVSIDYLVGEKSEQDFCPTSRPDDEATLLQRYRRLNQHGKSKARAYLQDLVENARNVENIAHYAAIAAESGEKLEGVTTPDEADELSAFKEYKNN